MNTIFAIVPIVALGASSIALYLSNARLKKEVERANQDHARLSNVTLKFEDMWPIAVYRGASYGRFSAVPPKIRGYTLDPEIAEKWAREEGLTVRVVPAFIHGDDIYLTNTLDAKRVKKENIWS